MKVLLDTHILLWAISGDDKLPQKAEEIIKVEENEIFYSVATVWEVTIKHMSHPENMPLSGRQFSIYCHKAGYKKLNIEDEHIYGLESLRRSAGAPEHHDPFDRLLIAQAKAESMMLLTHDPLLPYYGEECILLV